jgi:2-phospho-L-lactate transferase
MHITVLSGGVGGARFLTGLRAAVDSTHDSITVIGNTADDIWMFGLRICPDLDTVMYTLGDGIDLERGWGRRGETWHAKDELAAYGPAGSGSATATSRPISCGRRCSTRATRCRPSPPRSASGGSPASTSSP